MSCHIGTNEGSGHQDVPTSLMRVKRRSLVNRSKVEYATWGVNHVQGCTHGCLYCYAKTEAKAHGRVACDEDWSSPKLVAHAAWQVERELDRMRKMPDRVHLSFTTDPFMRDPNTGELIQEIADTTLDIIETINHYGIPVTVLTKGVYPEFDVRPLHSDNHYGITAVSLNDEYRAVWEPNAAPVRDRIEGLRRLSAQAAWTWVSMEPYPTPNIDMSARDPAPLLDELSFADKFIFGRLNYTKAVTEYLKNVDPDFYEHIAAQVGLWCRTHNKRIHFKRGTPLHREDTVDLLEAGPWRKVRVLVEQRTEPSMQRVKVNVIKV